MKSFKNILILMLLVSVTLFTSCDKGNDDELVSTMQNEEPSFIPKAIEPPTSEKSYGSSWELLGSTGWLKLSDYGWVYLFAYAKDDGSHSLGSYAYFYPGSKQDDVVKFKTEIIGPGLGEFKVIDDPKWKEYIWISIDDDCGSPSYMSVIGTVFVKNDPIKLVYDMVVEAAITLSCRESKVVTMIGTVISNTAVFVVLGEINGFRCAGEHYNLDWW